MKREVLRAEMLHQKLGEMEQALQDLDQQRDDAARLQEALAAYERLQGGEEALATLASGLFVKVQIVKDAQLFANVGDGVVVPKSLEQVRTDVEKHLADIGRHQAQLHPEFEKLLAQLDAMKEGFK